MQISVSIDCDRTQNGPPPPKKKKKKKKKKNLGAIGHPCYNEFCVLTNFVPTGFHCISQSKTCDLGGWAKFEPWITI